MTSIRTIPHHITVEPDQARERVLNFIRLGVQFCCEIDPRLKGMKDCIALYVGGVLESTPGWTSLRRRCVTRDDACHYALNLINAELTFQVNPETRPNNPLAREWVFLVELREDGRTG